MAAQIHMAGSTWIKVSRQLANRSFTASYSMTKAPNTRASGASHHRDRASRSARRARRDGAFPSVDMSGCPSARVVRWILAKTADLRRVLRDDVYAQRDQADRDELEVAQGE